MTSPLSIPVPNQPRVVSREGSKATFEIAGLYPGYGITLGNALRRVLLSSLPGAAVTLAQFPNAPHEFTTIPGIKETVLDIVLNLKQLRFKLFSEEPQVLTLLKKGAGAATSDDLKAPAQVTVVSKGTPIATLPDKRAELSWELTGEHGVGYVPAGLRQQEKIPIGSIALDAIFNPVRGANFTVEPMRVGDRTDYNRLLLTIETDGTMTPEEAFAEATRILVQQFSSVLPEGFRVSEEGGASAVLREPLAVLGLSARTVAVIETAGIRTVAGLVRKRKGDIAALEGIGAKALQEIVDALERHGLSLKT